MTVQSLKSRHASQKVLSLVAEAGPSSRVVCDTMVRDYSTSVDSYEESAIAFPCAIYI